MSFLEGCDFMGYIWLKGRLWACDRVAAGLSTMASAVNPVALHYLQQVLCVCDWMGVQYFLV
jgi:hypothetical protein